jgi:2-polyprenyl-3-methyl-5-hydroxy-6-metoxy-1,4-benzoquinol methylase
MTDDDRTHWNERYRQGQGPISGRANRRLDPYAAHVDALAAAVHSRGETPTALDVACGLGGTVLWLARRGWRVTGGDVSEEALEKARSAAAKAGVDERCTFLQVDLDHWRPQAESADLVTCFYFLDRSLWPALRDAVKPGGLFIQETFNIHRRERRPASNADHLLRPGEFLSLARAWGWTVLEHRFDGPNSERPVGALVAQRPRSILHRK